LTEVELCEGLVEIGENSFACCDRSITNINIPNSIRRITDFAFLSSLRTPIQLHDGIQSIGRWAFAGCIFTNFRVPPLITVIPNYMLCNCRALFSLELPENTTEVGNYAFNNCYCLRNVVFPLAAVFGDAIIIYGQDDKEIHTDLLQRFGSNVRITWELQHRFDGLPIHKLVYYQSYNQGVLQRLIVAINTRSGQRHTLRRELDLTGNQQDCLGMTPLHILACSSVHDLELYRVIVKNYPTNLITEDRWGALPLLYAFWGAAPAEIIEFLLESYQALYHGYEFNWTMMVETMGRTDTNTPKERIENLLRLKQMHFTEQPIDWEYLLNKFAQPYQDTCKLNMERVEMFKERMCFFFMCGLSECVKALLFKVWRDCIYNMIQTADYKRGKDNSDILHRIRHKLVFFEDELTILKEATTILELALWKKRINDTNHKQKTACHQKKVKVSTRQQCRVTCGADVIIGYVMPYLISTGDDESLSDESTTDDWTSVWI
jgi:hypothetical protein